MAVLNQFINLRPIVLWLLAALLSESQINLHGQTPASREYQVKAAFLFNFAQFVQWPETALTNADKPFCIGVLGDDPFGAALDETIQGEAINGHKIVVEHAQQLKDMKDCQMIFICKSEKSQLKEIMTELDSGAILTVSEIDGFAENGGIIHFYLEGGKVRFEINPTVAQRDGLKVSSQLLSLGKIITHGKGVE